MMNKIYIRDDFIKLGQALKLANLAQSGADAKNMILDGMVKVNGNVVLQRGKKLIKGDVVSCEKEEFVIESKNI